MALVCTSLSRSPTCRTSSQTFERLARNIRVIVALLWCVCDASKTIRVAGAAAELANVDCIFHGHHGMDLIGALQVGATIRSASMQEIVFTTPGILPEEAWSPLAALVKSPHLLEVVDGIVKIPTAPGLGIEVDEEAVERYRVSDDDAKVRT
eukprot:COSAG02_NODE_2007_length_10128_cov_5.313989_7_plen_152_part_00